MRADAHPRAPLRLTAALAALAAAALLATAWHALPPRLWATAAFGPAAGDAAQALFHFSTLPRAATAFLCGAGLALSGALLQGALDNPLAAPSTLGISAGAELALVATTLWAPGLLDGLGRETVATLGGLGAAGAVLGIATRRGFSPAIVILAGLSIGLFAAAGAAVLKLLDQEEVGALYLWGAGSLAGTDWTTVARLLPRLTVPALAAVALARPIGLLGLTEGGARGLGVAVLPVRAAAVVLAVLLATSVTASVGVIGFVEIAAPALARFGGARRFGARALHAALLGGCILVLVDAGTADLAERFALFLPTGALAALLGAPLLLALVGRLRGEAVRGDGEVSGAPRARGGPTTGRRLALLGGAALLALALATVVGRGGAGWSILGAGAGMDSAVTWRLPRSLAALGAGALLGSAGALLQRLTGNALAGPETLGLGAGAATGFAAALLFAPVADGTTLLLCGTAGAVAVLGVLMGATLRARFAPERFLLTGVALGAGLEALLGLVLALGDARATRLLAWMSGSTYAMGASGAATALGAAMALCPAALLLGRVLDALSLGPAVAQALGVALGPARGLTALLAAAMTGIAVETVGPLTFVGLIGPQLARALGFRRGGAHAAGAALCGALVMILADLLGRVLAAPFEIPAGLVAAAVGIPCFLALLGGAPPPRTSS